MSRNQTTKKLPDYAAAEYQQPWWPECCQRQCMRCGKMFARTRIPQDNSKKYCSTTCAKDAERDLLADRRRRFDRRRAA